MNPKAWLQILGSQPFDFVNPDPAVINIRSIGVVLARIPRFGGNTESGVLSIAQHCVEGARAILRDTGDRVAAAAFLVHDGHEAMIGDDVPPKIEALAIIAGELAGETDDWAETNRENAQHWVKAAFCELKRRADSVIYPAAGLPWPLPAEVACLVHEYDIRMLRTERDRRMAKSPASWAPDIENAVPIEGVDCSVWGESLAFALWMGVARELLPIYNERPEVPAPCSECLQCASWQPREWSSANGRFCCGRSRC